MYKKAAFVSCNTKLLQIHIHPQAIAKERPEGHLALPLPYHQILSFYRETDGSSHDGLVDFFYSTSLKYDNTTTLLLISSCHFNYCCNTQLGSCQWLRKA